MAGLLRRWLHRERPGLVWVADLVDHVNQRVGARHAAIGPSHFMRSDIDEEWVELICEHAILPYLQEQFFGEEHRLEEFRLGALRPLLGAPSAPLNPTGEESDAAPDAG